MRKKESDHILGVFEANYREGKTIMAATVIPPDIGSDTVVRGYEDLSNGSAHVPS